MPAGVPVLDSAQRGHHHLYKPHPSSDLSPGLGFGGQRLVGRCPVHHFGRQDTRRGPVDLVRRRGLGGVRWVVTAKWPEVCR
jgi:hypothetical protein